MRHMRTHAASSGTSRLARLAPFASAAESGAADPNGSPAPTSLPLEDEESLSLGGYRLPPKEIRDIVDAPPLPELSYSPHRDKILFLKRRSLPPLSELARPEEKLAGIRIDGNYNARSRMSFYTGIGIHSLTDDGKLGPEQEVHGFPDGAKINFVSWSRDGRHLSFSIRVDEEDNNSSKLRVWVADVESGKARPLFQSPDIFLNAVFDKGHFVWVNDSMLLVCTIPISRGAPPKKPLVPSGPKVQSNEQKNVVQVRTFQDLLKDEYDEDLFDYYSKSQLVLVSLDGTMELVGPPAIYTSIDPSPDWKYILVTNIHPPYSYIVPCGRFPKKVELWTTTGKFVREICDLSLAEDIPIASDSVRRGKRSINWRPDKPSTLYWVETQDGGDAKIEVSPRDIVYMESAEPINGEQPEAWPDKTSFQITNFPHPYPQLASLQKEMIRYQRKDGVQLTATIYLPPGYSPTKDGPLPCLVWSYPGEFKSKDAAGQVRGSPNEFAGIGPTSPLLWLARGFAILFGPTIPIIGEGDEEANDRYIEQLVASAEAAVEEAIRRGVAHPNKIAVGGHSYGAFMTANLLAHAPHLFCCGISHSGAYNRTLTPFGFQNEDRTLWEATNTYIEMSPFMSANKIKKPILLIHGEEDNNSGTLTMQFDRSTQDRYLRLPEMPRFQTATFIQ
ncbi:hypothetical protein MUK42_11709 [Musa troglodytarum]|uniref:Probable glutamyl endopeptidase, chloroplastic n=1 Tax=Musa troglodytarum TaxID=320322 RepID=A0A9E7I1P9_9LILI|nr:hypothetical protein MUK42_11709 [Musa troglodytarum]